MHISIENLGAVNKAEFDLKPLTVFIGGNRQGKTQALYLSTAFLECLSFGTDKYIAEYGSNKKLHFDEFDSLYPQLVKNGNTSIDIVAFFKNHGQEYLNKLSSLAPKYTSEIIGTSHLDYSKVKLDYVLSKDEIRKCSTALKKLDFDGGIAGLGLKIVKEKGKTDVFMYKTDKYSDNTPATEITRQLLGVLLQNIHMALGYCPFYFPSERLGVSFIVQMLSQMNLGKLMKLGEENKSLFNAGYALYPYPVQQFIALQLFTSSNAGPSGVNQLTNSRQKRLIKSLSDVFTREIVGENIVLKSEEKDAPKEILVEVDGKIIDLSAASSGVKGLSGFVLYLRNLAAEGFLVVIDEPELNLHPTLQVKFIEFLTALVNAGIKVAITTHSPYIVEHLQNLIRAHDLKDASEVVDTLFLKRKESLIDKKNVGVYVFANGTAESILADDGTINWQTFCDTTNEVWNVSNTIFAAKEDEKEGWSSSDAGASRSLAEDNGEYK